MLTFFSVMANPSPAFSSDEAGDPLIVTTSTRINAPNTSALDNQRRAALVEYIRGQAVGLSSSLPEPVRNPASWAVSGFNAGRGFFNLGLSALDDDETQDAAPLPPTPGAGAAATPAGGDTTWLSSAYHHRQGLLPTHDAMTMGFHSEDALLDNYLRWDMHPYVAQSMFSGTNYWGAELGFDLASPTAPAEASKPWGKITLGYTNGDGNLMDHGRGVSLRGEVKFSERIALTTGLRQNDWSGSDNYALLQWKMLLE